MRKPTKLSSSNTKYLPQHNGAMGKKSLTKTKTHLYTNRSAEVGHADGVDIFTVGAAQQVPALNVQGVDGERLVTDEGVDFQLG